MNIVLIGYRGTGKSAVGRRLAERLGFAFCDTDDLVEQHSGQSIEGMVLAKGWVFFRQCEQAAIRRLAGADMTVIAAGGGAVLDADNVQLLKQNGRMIWLIAGCKDVIARMQADQGNEKRRPPLTGGTPDDETEALLAARTPIYRAVADVSVETSGKSVEQIVDEICSRL